MKCANVKRELSPTVKACGHANCHLGTNLCCECEDKRPIARRHERYVDGKGMVSVTRRDGMAWGYCPGCKLRLRLPGGKRCFCGIVGCDLTASEWCCACLDARPREDYLVRYKRGQRGVLYRGMHYCSNCVKLENVVKDRKNAIKNAKTENVRGKENLLIWANNPVLESTPTPVIAPTPGSPTPASAGSSGPTQSSLTALSSRLSVRPSDRQGHDHQTLTRTPEENANVDLNLTPSADTRSANATISPPDAADDEFVFPEKPPAIEVPVDFELVEHAEVAQIGWKTTRARWSSLLWKY